MWQMGRVPADERGQGHFELLKALGTLQRCRHSGTLQALGHVAEDPVEPNFDKT